MNDRCTDGRQRVHREELNDEEEKSDAVLNAREVDIQAPEGEPEEHAHQESDGKLGTSSRCERVSIDEVT